MKLKKAVTHQQSPSPTNLYPPAPFISQKTYVARVPTPPKMFPASKQPKDWRSTSMKYNDGDLGDLLTRLGTKTYEKRAGRYVRENSKGIQCEIQKNDTPLKPIQKADAQVQADMTQIFIR